MNILKYSYGLLVFTCLLSVPVIQAGGPPKNLVLREELAGNTVKLSWEGAGQDEFIEIELSAAQKSEALKLMIEDFGGEDIGSIPVKTSKNILRRVAKCLRALDQFEGEGESLRAFIDVDVLGGLSNHDLYNTMNLANFLDIKPLLNECVAIWAGMCSRLDKLHLFKSNNASHLANNPAFVLVPELARLVAKKIASNNGVLAYTGINLPGGITADQVDLTIKQALLLKIIIENSPLNLNDLKKNRYLRKIYKTLPDWLQDDLVTNNRVRIG